MNHRRKEGRKERWMEKKEGRRERKKNKRRER